MSHDTNAIPRATAGGLRAYLTGYGRKNRDGLLAIVQYGGWPELAVRETEHRFAQILETLPMDEVLAIARQEINLSELARQVLADLDKPATVVSAESSAAAW